MAEFTKEILFHPAYDKRNPEPSKNYGIHGVTLTFLLKGPLGATQFVLYTNWQLPHVEKEQEHRVVDREYPHLMCKPMPADLGYHSPIPIYDGQTTVRGACEWLDGKPCYYDGSSLNAERIFDVLRAEGHEGVWRELEEYYRDTFEPARRKEA